MNTKKLLFEQVIRYSIIFAITALLWSPIKNGLTEASQYSDNLEAVAVIMGLVSICALYGYFSFSYTTVSKNALHRTIGYVCTSLLTIALIITWLTMYFLAVIWVPTMKGIWIFTFVTLYAGVFIFDILDLFRMGMDVAATSFFEKGLDFGNSSTSNTIKLLKEGQRLAFANALIGKAMVEIGEKKKSKKIKEGGEWVLKNSHKTQFTIDKKVATTFETLGRKNKKIKSIIDALKKGQSQNIADSLIANLLELAE